MTIAACVSARVYNAASFELTPFEVTAFGGAMGIENPSKKLRDEVANYILDHPNEYNKAILGEEPLVYTNRMRQMDTWGGAIELSILSDIYNVEISSIDVKVWPLFLLGSLILQLNATSRFAWTVLARTSPTVSSSSTRAFTTTG